MFTKAWALGIDVLPLLLGPTSDADVPWPLRDRPSIRAVDPTAWNDLVLQLSQRLQVSVRDLSQLSATDDAADEEEAYRTLVSYRTGDVWVRSTCRDPSGAT